MPSKSILVLMCSSVITYINMLLCAKHSCMYGIHTHWTCVHSHLAVVYIHMLVRKSKSSNSEIAAVWCDLARKRGHREWLSNYLCGKQTKCVLLLLHTRWLPYSMKWPWTWSVPCSGQEKAIVWDDWTYMQLQHTLNFELPKLCYIFPCIKSPTTSNLCDRVLLVRWCFRCVT